jgi:hypothetical protein
MREVANAIISMSDEQLEREYRDSKDDTMKVIYDLAIIARGRIGSQTPGERAAEKIYELLSNTSGASLAWTHDKVLEVLKRWSTIIDEEFAGVKKGKK